MGKKQDAGRKLNELFAIMSKELHEKETKNCEFRKFAVDRLVQRMRKRAKLEEGILHTKAIADFISTNALVGDVVVNLPESVVFNAKYFITRVLENYTTSLTGDIQQCLDPSVLLSNWRFGPGTSNGIQEKTHTAEKIYEDMTCTLLSKPLVVMLRKSNAYFCLRDETTKSDGTQVVSGSRLTTVLKNETTRRTIAIEPSGNMCLQLAAGMYFEGALKYIGLDIHDQERKNKFLAHRGSIFNDIATVDLKSASDMFSIQLVRALLPDRWFKLLMLIRSQNIKVGKEEVALNMMSTMGNGFTFPLMTLLLCSLIYANRLLNHSGPTLFIDWSSTAVYGDDIIVPVGEFGTLCVVLEQAGLIINHEKSYFDGWFRESCGGDFFAGYDVTPFYVKAVSNDREIYVVINQVMLWTATHNCSLPLTLIYLKSLLTTPPLLIPEWHNPDEGVLTSLVQKRYKFLQTQVSRKKLYLHGFLMMLAIGGYVSSASSDVIYAPRLFKTYAHVRKSRLPNGYLDGWDPIKRSKPISDFISVTCGFLFQ